MSKSLEDALLAAFMAGVEVGSDSFEYPKTYSQKNFVEAKYRQFRASWSGLTSSDYLPTNSAGVECGVPLGAEGEEEAAGDAGCTGCVYRAGKRAVRKDCPVHSLTAKRESASRR